MYNNFHNLNIHQNMLNIFFVESQNMFQRYKMRDHHSQGYFFGSNRFRVCNLVHTSICHISILN